MIQFLRQCISFFPSIERRYAEASEKLSAVDAMLKKNEDLHVRQMHQIDLEAKKLELEERQIALEEKKFKAWE